MPFMQSIVVSGDSARNPLSEILKDYISRPDFCRALQINTNTAEKWAVARKGPPVTIIARRAYYHIADVQKWIEAQRPAETATRPRARVLR